MTTTDSFNILAGLFGCRGGTSRGEEHLPFYQAYIAAHLGGPESRLGQFDLILLNAVLEHIPLSLVGRRQRLLLTCFDLLRPSGYLYINETPTAWRAAGDGSSI